MDALSILIEMKERSETRTRGLDVILALVSDAKINEDDLKLVLAAMDLHL